MAIHLKQVYLETKEKYKLQLVAGEAGLDYMMNWLYRMESLEDIEFLKGNELIITTGFTFQEEESLLQLIKALERKKCCGLILNIGKYIDEVPLGIRAYCNAKAFPLFEMPWEVHIMELSRDYYKRIEQSEHRNQELSEAFHVILEHPDTIETYRYLFEKNGFLEKQSYYCILMHQFQQKQAPLTLAERLAYIMGQWQHSFVFAYEENYLMIAEAGELLQLKEVLNVLQIKLKEIYGSHLEMYYGIGSKAEALSSLMLSLKDAKSALQKGIYFKEPITAFEEMGVYQILMSVANPSVLQGYYEKYLGPLEAYDKAHHMQLIETLRLYLKYDGAVSRVAQELFMHRNTVNHRMSRIKEILHMQLETSEECLNVQIALYINDLYALRRAEKA